jgi:hypothetical protein
MGIAIDLLTEKFDRTGVIKGFKEMIGENSGTNIADIFYDNIKLFELRKIV